MRRDFSDGALNLIVDELCNVATGNEPSLTHWSDCEQWTEFSGDVERAIDRTNRYYEQVVRKNLDALGHIKGVYRNVQGIDRTYGNRLLSYLFSLDQWGCYIDQLTMIMEPTCSNLSSDAMDSLLTPTLAAIVTLQESRTYPDEVDNYSLKAKYDLSKKGPLKKLNEHLDTFYKDEWGTGVKYYKDGKIIAAEDAPTFYKRQITWAEESKKLGGDKGYMAAGEGWTFGSWEYGTSMSWGLYTIGAGKERILSPGFKFHTGGSFTTFTCGELSNQLLGNEDLGMYGGLKVDVGKAELSADAIFQFFDVYGKPNAQANINLNLEALAGALSGDLGVNILGNKLGVKGSLTWGIGAHAKFGYKDGVISADVGAALGPGAALAVDADIGATIDAAGCAIDYVGDHSDDIGDWFVDCGEWWVDCWNDWF